MPVAEQAIWCVGVGLVKESLHRLTGQNVPATLDEWGGGCGMCDETAAPR